MSPGELFRALNLGDGSAPQADKPRTNTLAVVLGMTGILGAFVSFRSLNWISGDTYYGESPQPALNFSQLQAIFQMANTSGQADQLAVAYFGGLAWASLLVCACCLGGALLSNDGRSKFQLGGVLACGAATVLTFRSVFGLHGPWRVNQAGTGLWVAAAGFVLIGLACTRVRTPVAESSTTDVGCADNGTALPTMNQQRVVNPAMTGGMLRPSARQRPPSSGRMPTPPSAPVPRVSPTGDGLGTHAGSVPATSDLDPHRATTAPRTPAGPPPPTVPPGWLSDPLQRWELRYWDGSAWTKHVSSQGRTGVDAPDR